MTSLINPTLLSELQNGGTCNAMIEMIRQPQEVFDQLEVEQFPNRDAKVEAMTCRLTALMNESQKHLMEFLDKQNVATNSFWISNTMLVENASLELLQQLEKMGGIKEIRKEMMATIKTYIQWMSDVSWVLN